MLGTLAAAADRDHEAHVHGLSRLNVVVEGQTVEMEWMAPGADIVGFEHEGRSAEDKATIQDAMTVLIKGEELFLFPAAAKCRLDRASVESGLTEDDHGDGKRGAYKPDSSDHAEFHAHYRFRCDRPADLSHIDLRLFKHFPAAREVEVQLISPRGQSAQELTPAASRLRF